MGSPRSTRVYTLQKNACKTFGKKKVSFCKNASQKKCFVALYGKDDLDVGGG